jgi:16S rRNA pseudouridine516 synthase
MRLDRLVSQVTGSSRREARALIRQGRVALGDRIVRDTGAPVAAQIVRLDGEVLTEIQPLYLMLHKPLGVIVATRDPRQRTVLDLLPREIARRVHPVGRLDKQTSGLLLLSDDGSWSHRIASPRHRCGKVYLVRLADPLCADAESRLAAGLALRNEARPARPASIERLGEREVRVTVTEGRYHLVRRLFAALGNRVVSLHRERIGGLPLDPGLHPGEWRTLSQAEREDVLPTQVVG